MHITISGKHRNLSDSLKTYIEERVSELSHLYGRAIKARVVVDMESKNHVVAMNLRVPGSNTLNSEDKSTNLRSAIDSSVDKLAKQLVKHKEKTQRKSVRTHGPRTGEPVGPAVESGLPAEHGAILTFEIEEDQAE
ncbi:MAG: ribosome-associated translation inhibitor RaiA [Gemmatimonadota bacterium]|nr:ribosome-associated translation inhibitor RaiA [Gemmatimonadota bacterium]